MNARVFVSAIFLGSVLAAHAGAATVRGRVTHQDGRPAAGYAVTVSNPQHGRSTPAKVGSDGMFYVSNIPQGSYSLEVWVPGQSPRVYQIQVHEPYTDVAQVAVP